MEGAKQPAWKSAGGVGGGGWGEGSGGGGDLSGKHVYVALQGSFRDHCPLREVNMAYTLCLQTKSLDLKCPRKLIY